MVAEKVKFGILNQLIINHFVFGSAALVVKGLVTWIELLPNFKARKLCADLLFLGFLFDYDSP